MGDLQGPPLLHLEFPPCRHCRHLRGAHVTGDQLDDHGCLTVRVYDGGKSRTRCGCTQYVADNF